MRSFFEGGSSEIRPIATAVREHEQSYAPSSRTAQETGEHCDMEITRYSPAAESSDSQPTQLATRLRRLAMGRGFQTALQSPQSIDAGLHQQSRPLPLYIRQSPDSSTYPSSPETSVTSTSMSFATRSLISPGDMLPSHAGVRQATLRVLQGHSGQSRSQSAGSVSADTDSIRTLFAPKDLRFGRRA